MYSRRALVLKVCISSGEYADIQNQTIERTVLDAGLPCGIASYMIDSNVSRPASFPSPDRGALDAWGTKCVAKPSVRVGASVCEVVPKVV